METLLEQVQSYGPLILNVAKAFVTLVIGWIVANTVGSLARRKVNNTPEIDPTLGNFIASMVKWVILLMVLAAVLSIFGIQATSLVAMLSAATLAIGLALQGTLSDIAAGFMLTLFRPYKLGQYVDIGGTAGTVKDLNLFVTELTTPDNVQVIVPNGQAWGRSSATSRIMTPAASIWSLESTMAMTSTRRCKSSPIWPRPICASMPIPPRGSVSPTSATAAST